MIHSDNRDAILRRQGEAREVNTTRIPETLDEFSRSTYAEREYLYKWYPELYSHFCRMEQTHKYGKGFG